MTDLYGTPGTVFSLSLCENRRAKEVRAVVMGVPSGPQPPPWNSFYYQILFWKGVQSYIDGNANPNNPVPGFMKFDLGLPTNNQPYPGPPCNGQLEYLCPWSYSWFAEPAPGAWIPTYEFRWDLTQRIPQQVILQPGEWVVSAISTLTNGTNSHMWMSFSSATGGPSGVYGSNGYVTPYLPPFWNYTKSGWPVNWAMGFRTMSTCPSGVCDPWENRCNCPQDCGAPPSHEVAGSTCGDGIDNDCDKASDCADADCATDSVACPNGQIPAVSDWGMVILTLLTLTAGTLVVMRRHAA